MKMSHVYKYCNGESKLKYESLEECLEQFRDNKPGYLKKNFSYIIKKLNINPYKIFIAFAFFNVHFHWPRFAVVF